MLESFLYVFDICMHLLIALLWERVNRIFDRLTGPEEKKRREDRRARKEFARQRRKAEKRE